MFIDKDYLKDKYFYYRGVTGSVEWSPENNSYWGKLAREYHDNGWKVIDGCCTYTGEDLEGLYANFVECVDDYFKANHYYNIGETFFNKV